LEGEVAKGQKRNNREPKKPKATKKPAPVKSSFIQPASEKQPMTKTRNVAGVNRERSK